MAYKFLAEINVTHHDEKAVPPESTTTAYKFLQMSSSHFMMEWLCHREHEIDEQTLADANVHL